MLAPQSRIRLSQTCLRTKPGWGVATHLSRPIRRYVSTQEPNEITHTGSHDQLTPVVHGHTGGFRTIKPGGDSHPFVVKVRMPDGSYAWRKVKRSYPNGKAEDFMRELVSLITYPKLSSSNDGVRYRKDLSSDGNHMSLAENATRKESTEQTNSVSDLQTSQWRLTLSGQFILRTIRLAKEQYPPLLNAIEKEANLLKHHPHILGYELDGHYIVNIICTTHRPAGLSRKDTTLAISINGLLSNLNAPTPPVDHDATKFIIGRLWELNLIAAARRTEELQTDSTSGMADSRKSISTGNSSSKKGVAEERGLPDRQVPPSPSPSSSILSVESTILKTMIRRKEGSINKLTRVIQVDTVRAHKQRSKSAGSKEQLPLTKPSNESATDRQFASDHSGKEETKSHSDDHQTGKPVLLKPCSNPRKVKSTSPKLSPVLNPMPMAISNASSSSDSIPRIDTPARIRRIILNSSPPTPLIRRVAIESNSATLQPDKRDETSASNSDLGPQLKIVRTTLGDNIVRSTLVLDDQVHITKKYDNEEPLTAGDVLRGTRPGSEYEKNLIKRWGHLF